MDRKQIIIILLIFLSLPSLYAAKKDSTKVASLNHYSLTVGVGWAHYVNTLEIGKDNASINSAGVSLKFFWEPEHRLSLGLETGFYRLYKVKMSTETDAQGEATMSAMPLLLNIRMRIVDNFYLSAGGGLAIMFNKVNLGGEKINSNILSLSNFQVSGSYIYPLTNHWQVGGEVKVLTFGKTADWMYTVQAVCALKL